MIEQTITLPRYQANFLNIEEKFGLFRGGLGCGKTYILCVHAIQMALEYPNTRGLITANSYKQLTTATLQCLFGILQEKQIPYSYAGGSKGELKIFGTVIDCRSMSNYEDLRGTEYGWSACDEAALYKREAWNVLIGRVRCTKGPRTVRCATTPKGFNWLWDFFEDEKDDTKKTVTAKTTDNKYLPDDYFKTLESQYDSKLLLQETQGEYINVNSGAVYSAFDRNVHVMAFDELEKTRMKGMQQRRVGVDFNVNPITACSGWVYMNCLYIRDEIYKENSNTYELADELYKKYRTHKVTLHPDSTGKNRKTSSTATDHSILKAKGYALKVTSNPKVKDRYNCVNGLFAHNRIIIHPDCKKLIKDLEQFTHENDDVMLSHMSDCLGYLCWSQFPLRDPRKPNRTISL